MTLSQPILDQTDPIFVVPSYILLTWAVWVWLFGSLAILLGHKQRLPYGVHTNSIPHSWPGEGPLPLFGFGAVWEWHSVLSTELTEVAILLFCCSKWWTWHLVGRNIKTESSVLIGVSMHSGDVPRLLRVCVLKVAEILQGKTDERLQRVTSSFCFEAFQWCKYDFYEFLHTMYGYNLGHIYRSAYTHILVASTDLMQAVNSSRLNSSAQKTGYENASL